MQGEKALFFTVDNLQIYSGFFKHGVAECISVSGVAHGARGYCPYLPDSLICNIVCELTHGRDSSHLGFRRDTPLFAEPATKPCNPAFQYKLLHLASSPPADKETRSIGAEINCRQRTTHP